MSAVNNRVALQQIVQGQAERNILDISKNGYLGKMRVMTDLLNLHEDIRLASLETDEHGHPLKHIGIYCVYTGKTKLRSEIIIFCFARQSKQGLEDDTSNER